MPIINIKVRIGQDYIHALTMFISILLKKRSPTVLMFSWMQKYQLKIFFVKQTFTSTGLAPVTVNDITIRTERQTWHFWTVRRSW